jgi:hypothetical protein
MPTFQILVVEHLLMAVESTINMLFSLLLEPLPSGFLVLLMLYLLLVVVVVVLAAMASMTKPVAVVLVDLCKCHFGSMRELTQLL